MSEHKTLNEALVAFQAEMPTLPKDTTNPHFRSKFTSLDTIVERAAPLLTKHGLRWSALPTIADGRPALRYELAHVGGDVLTDTMPLLLTKDDSQGLGSALTYARRYALCAVLNLVADEDDDGNAASRNGAGSRPQATAQAPAATDRPASAGQRGMLNAKAAEVDLAPTDFADAILRATGSDPRDFESQEHAAQWVKRALDRLPARLVDAVIVEIKKATDGAVTA